MLLFAQRKLWMTLTLPKAPVSILVVFVTFFSATTGAQSPGPREFLNIPVHQAVAYFDYVATDTETVAVDLPLPNNQSISRVIIPTILVSFPMNNRWAGLSVSLPSSRVEVNGPAGKVETFGLNDPAIAFHKNLFGLPALRQDEFAGFIPKTLMSVHFTVNPPLGSYDRNSPVNTGANRWAFTPLVNLDIPLSKGVAWVEAYAWGRFFTNNSEFRGNNLLSQHPLGIVAAWYSHNIGKKMYAGIGGYYDAGGESYINHIAQHDAAHAFRPSVAINRKIWKLGITLRYENTASKSNTVSSSGLLLLRVAVPPLFNF